MISIVEKLLQSNEPAVRFKVQVNVLRQDVHSTQIHQLQHHIQTSPRVQQLLSERDTAGNIPWSPYTKWCGAHWVLADLADIGYPSGDSSLIPLREQVYEWLLGPKHQKSIRAINGRIRRCASQEGNALYYLLKLGLADERTDELAACLVKWQWPDGGWNCDKKPEAVHSSFMESLIPLRSLALHARLTGNLQSQKTAEHAAEVFLKRHLYKRQRDGCTIDETFLQLHYPCYWHYDILFGLKVLTEAGFISDPRCQDALDVLESKRLPDGGFPAEKTYYRLTNHPISGRSLVNWGGVSKRHMNEFVTADALFVLRSGKRLSV